MNTSNSDLLELFLLWLMHFDKILITHSPKSHNLVQNTHLIQILLIIVSIFAYYAGIVLNAFASLLSWKLCWHNRLKPTQLWLTQKD